MSKYYKHPQYGMVFGHDTVTPSGRLVWSSLVKPKENTLPPKPGQAPTPPRYEQTILLDKSRPEVKAFIDELTVTTDEMLVEFNQGKKAQLGNCKVVADGDEFDMEKYPYYKNCWVIVARNAKSDFKILNEKKETTSPDIVKGGMIGKLLVQPLITAHGISYKLIAVKIVKDDGVRFGGGSRTDGDLASKFDDAEDVIEEGASELVPEEMIPVAPEVVNTLLAVPTPMPAPAQAAAFDPNALRAAQAAKVKGKQAAFNKL